MSKNSKKQEPEIDEERAYLELCQIIAEAIQTQDINLLECRIAEWKRRYPYEKFSKNLKAKIDYLLNYYYSEVINQILKTIKQNKEKKEFNQHKAIVKLYKMIKETNDIKDLNKKVDKWKKEYPIDDFMDMYKRRAKKFTSKKYLEENAFDTDQAFVDLCDLLKKKATYQELQEGVSEWEEEYSIGDKYSEDDFKSHSNEVKRFLDEEYLYSISTEAEKEDSLAKKESSMAIQSAHYAKFMKLLEKGNKAKIVEWIYKNRNITFGDYYKDKIISQTAFKYPMSLLENSRLEMNLNERGLSFDEYQNMDDSRKYIITAFIKYLMQDKKIAESTFQKAFNKSEEAKLKSFHSESQRKEELKEDIATPTLVISLNNKKEERDIQQEQKEETQNNLELQITELEPTEYVSKTKEQEETSPKKDENTEETYIVVHPDFLRMAYEKSKAAEMMSTDYPKQIHKAHEENEGTKHVEVSSISDIDKVVSEEVHEERVAEENILAYRL